MSRLIQAFVSLGIALLALGCADDIVTPLDPEPKRTLAFAQGTLLDESGAALVDYGRVAIGRKARAIVVLENLSELPLELGSLAGSLPFEVEDDPPAVISPRGRQSIALTFVPEREEVSTETLVITSAGGDLVVRLQGEGVEVGETCRFDIHPTSLRFTVGAEDPGIPWAVQTFIETHEGPCLLEDIEIEGSLVLQAEANVGKVLLPGTRSPFVLVATAPSMGESAAVRITIGEATEEVRVEAFSETVCMTLLDASLSFRPGLECNDSQSVHFTSSCPETPGLRDVHLVARDASDSFEDVSKDEVTFQYTANSTTEKSEAIAVLDFENGDRLYVSLHGEAHMVEETFVIEAVITDLLFVVDKGEAMEAYQGHLSDFAGAVSDWMETTLQDVQVGVTSTAIEDVATCAGERGGLIPIGEPGLQVVKTTTEDREEVLRQNLLAVGTCMPEGHGKGFEAASLSLSKHSGEWMREDSRRTLFFIAAEEDSSPKTLFEYMQLLDREQVGYVYAASPAGSCGGELEPPSSRYEDMTQYFQGSFAPICDEPRWRTNLLAEIEAKSRVSQSFPLDGWLTEKRAGETEESAGHSLWVGGKAIPSVGSSVTPMWEVKWPGTLEVGWGLPPGTEVTLRYPPAGTSCR